MNGTNQIPYLCRMIRITKIFTFETAHVLYNYDGKCKNMHGHSYKLFVTVKGKPVNDLENPKNGMVVDFGDIKSIVKSEIVDVGIMRFSSTDFLRTKNWGRS
jgi:6-pyruvoyltetrahydropterin/6-carboxytetrahydropterin synthase